MLGTIRSFNWNRYSNGTSYKIILIDSYLSYSLHYTIVDMMPWNVRTVRIKFRIVLL